ncbi:MAG: IS66 family insertion sequence element accessory protein TnpA, partial [Butyricicoccus porcorum]
MVSNGRNVSSTRCVSGAGVSNAHTGVQCQWIDEREFCQQRGISEKSFYYWLRKLRTQMVGSVAPQLVQLEPVPTMDDTLQIQYRGAELKLPAGVD